MLKDQFSKQAKLYSKFRPHYPQALYDFIYSKVAKFDTAWDCATGNGQVARVLSEKFKKVYATDISQQQINHATQRDNIIYSIGSAEESELFEKVDLITVAQALHWFEPNAFYKEVQRLSHDNTILAYWMYGLPQVNAQVDPSIITFNDDTMEKYWDEARKIWRTKYSEINFPLKNKQQNSFYFETQWTLEHMEGYLTSWSSVQNYIAQHKENPVTPLIDKLKSLWSGTKTVRFPIFLTLGCVA